MKQVVTDRAPRDTGPYSQGIRAGDFLFVSGQGPLDPATGNVVPGDIAAQTRLTLANIEAVVTAAGGTLRDVVRVTVFLAGMEHYAAFNAVYREFFSHEPRPTRTTVAAGLVDILVEMDAIAYLGADR